MSTQPKTQQQLLAENEDLRARLEQAEGKLQEILSGEADALFVASVGGEQMFTLQSADYSYRLLIEEMSEGVLTLTAEGVILFANKRVAEMIKMPLEKVIGATIYTWMAPDAQQILQSLLDKSLAGKCCLELELSASDGTRVPVYLSASKHLISGMPDTFCLVAIDLTEQKRSEALAASEKMAQELLETSNQARRALLSVIEDQKQAEAEVKHANRALAALSEVNRMLVHATREDELLQAICQIIVEHRGYRLAWVGYVQQDADKSIKIMTSANHDEGYVDTMHLTWAETERGMGPSGRAVRSGTTQVCQDVAGDPQYLPWRNEALKRGYASSIALPLLDGMGTVFGTLNVYAGEVQAFTAGEIKLLEEMASDLAFGVHTLRIRQERDLALSKNLEQLTQLQESLENTVRAIATIVEMRDPYTAGHQVRVADLATAIAAQMGLPEEEVHAIHIAGIVHDLGKIRIPAEILSKPGKISDIEFSLIKTHAEAGYEILKDIHFPWPVAQMVLQHHERLDGSGYPKGLKGDQIITGARILGVADVVEAMSSHRPYRAGLGIETALEEIKGQRGGSFDPQVVDACLAVFHERQYSFKS
jgi:PAS domain S-box-containing protein/putative nucleotidyltransferase with HDIG domain